VGPCQQKGEEPSIEGRDVPTRAPNSYYHYTILRGFRVSLFKDINYLANI